MNLAASILTFTILSILVYLFLIRPYTLRWGATKDEFVCHLPGDEIVKKTHFVATRAVTVSAPPAKVWKWVVQIGSARAGWYSHDWIDNAGVESSHEILPQFQKIENDYFIPFTPDQNNGMWVKSYREHEYILWWDMKARSTWLWKFDEIEPGKTRLLTRLRTQYNFTFPWVIYYILYDLGDIIMMSKCMLGIKTRAEMENHHQR